MREAEVRIDAWLRKRVLINRAYVGKSSRGQFVSSGEQNCESTKQGGPLVTLWPLLGPGPSHGVAYGDVDCVRHKTSKPLSHCHIEI